MNPTLYLQSDALPHDVVRRRLDEMGIAFTADLDQAFALCAEGYRVVRRERDPEGEWREIEFTKEELFMARQDGIEVRAGLSRHPTAMERKLERFRRLRALAIHGGEEEEIAFRRAAHTISRHGEALAFTMQCELRQFDRTKHLTRKASDEPAVRKH